MASADDGLSDGNPKSSSVNPVSPANPLAAVLNCSVNCDIDGVVNCPNLGSFHPHLYQISSCLILLLSTCPGLPLQDLIQLHSSVATSKTPLLYQHVLMCVLRIVDSKWLMVLFL